MANLYPVFLIEGYFISHDAGVAVVAAENPGEAQEILQAELLAESRRHHSLTPEDGEHLDFRVRGFIKRLDFGANRIGVLYSSSIDYSPD